MSSLTREEHRLEKKPEWR